jgi:hypothetical protein
MVEKKPLFIAIEYPFDGIGGRGSLVHGSTDF